MRGIGLNKADPAMQRVSVLGRIAMMSTLAALLWLHPVAGGVATFVVLCIFLVRLDGMERQVIGIIRSMGGDPRSRRDSLASQVADLVAVRDAQSHRLPRRHATSGLPTRETLIEAMQESSGLLGVLELADFDRLCAIDPAQAEQLLTAVARRVVRMTNEARTIAQVDRARIAIWFGPIEEAAARAEFQAIVYALSTSLGDDGNRMLPVVRSGVLVCDGESLPETLLARAFVGLRVNGSGDAPDPCNSEAATQDFRLEQDLRQAIAAGQLELCFQPFIDAKAGKLCGAEALLRWHHPERGSISPAIFIPLAERAGLADEIGSWVLNAACREAGHWSAAGLSGVKVAVNVSARQLEREGLATLVERALGHHALPPYLLELELTETAAAVDVRAAQRLFDQLRRLGSSIAIDDFGTGYSSLSSLRQLSFDKLKIDRAFVTDVDRRPDSQAICESIIALGRGLGICVLAEGVERAEEMEWLRNKGCWIFQGFYFAKPMSGHDLILFARDRETLAERLHPSAANPALPPMMSLAR